MVHRNFKKWYTEISKNGIPKVQKMVQQEFPKFSKNVTPKYTKNGTIKNQKMVQQKMLSF